MDQERKASELLLQLLCKFEIISKYKLKINKM